MNHAETQEWLKGLLHDLQGDCTDRVKYLTDFSDDFAAMAGTQAQLAQRLADIWEVLQARDAIMLPEILHLKQLCRQAKGCLVGGCQGIPDRVSLLCDELGKASAGVEFPALPEPTPEWIAEYGRRILEHYPGAVFVDGKWVATP